MQNKTVRPPITYNLVHDDADDLEVGEHPVVEEVGPIAPDVVSKKSCVLGALVLHTKRTRTETHQRLGSKQAAGVAHLRDPCSGPYRVPPGQQLLI